MPSNESVEIKKVGKNKLQAIRQLAFSIWPATYSSIISNKQINYMLELFYSDKALLKDFSKQNYHFFILNVAGEDLEYAGVEAKDNQIWHLHKIYLSQKLQGKGFGKMLIRHVEDFAKDNGASYLTLNVNRYNKALAFYKTCGYETLREEDINIGSGFFMNDYVMQKKL